MRLVNGVADALEAAERHEVFQAAGSYLCDVAISHAKTPPGKSNTSSSWSRSTDWKPAAWTTVARFNQPEKWTALSHWLLSLEYFDDISCLRRNFYHYRTRDEANFGRPAQKMQTPTEEENFRPVWIKVANRILLKADATVPRRPDYNTTRDLIRSAPSSGDQTIDSLLYRLKLANFDAQDN